MDVGLDAAVLIRSARRRARRSLRDLAAAAGTSHSTLAAYERGAKVPGVATLDRILRACGFEGSVRLVPCTDREERGRELIEVLELADVFPTDHEPVLGGPPFGPVR